MSEKRESDAPELLVDGSFESAKVKNNSWSHFKTVGGWTSDTEVEVWGKKFYGLSASDGDRFAELDYDRGASNIYQHVQTEAGTEYTFSFDYMKRPDSKAGSDTINVFWNGELVGTVEPSKSEWSTATFKVVGTGGSDRIEFRESSEDNDSYGGLLDNASLKRSGPTAAEREVAAKAEQEAEDKAGKAPNNDDLKHDGRDHGDGDHNDDGHTDNGRGPRDRAGGKDGDGEQDEVKKPTLSLATEDAKDVVTGVEIVGSKDVDKLAGGRGGDTIVGNDGDDAITGDRVGTVSVPLHIKAGLVDAADPDAVLIEVRGLPEGAVLSAGERQKDGSWVLTAAELDGLVLTTPDSADLDLTVVARSTDGSGLEATSAVHVSLLDGVDDTLVGGKGNDVLSGDAGDDMIFGGSRPTGVVNPHAPTFADNDVIHGGLGNDHIWGNSGDDRLFGDEGNDTIHGGKGDDHIEGGVGNDTLSGNTGNDTLLGGDGDDDLNGNAGDDVLADGAGNDRVMGSSGDDRVEAGAGDDVYNGGSGFDTIDFSAATQGMTIDLSKKTAAGMGSDTLSNFEVVIGSAHADVMKGSKAGETLAGGAGDDVLRGLGGADVLTGGEGDDTFVFLKKDVLDVNGRHLGVDRVTDLSAGDRLDLSDFLKGQRYGSIDEVVKVTDGAEGSTISVKLGTSFVDVVVLDGVHDQTAADLMQAGMLLA